MSVDSRELMAWQSSIETLINDIPEFMDKLAIGEGVYAVKQARTIIKNDGIVNTGEYRRNFHTGNKGLSYSGELEHDGSRPRHAGKTYLVDVYNNLDYAKHLEWGFRSHFVPGHWEGNTFVYQKNDPSGGMYVGPTGGYVNGHFVLKRAMRRLNATQDARCRRKTEQFINDYIGG